MRNANDDTLKDVLKQFVNSKGVKPKVLQAKIVSMWPQVMGQTIANYTTQIVLKKEILYLSISSSSLKQELTFGKDKIVKIINEELGEAYLKDVVIY